MMKHKEKTKEQLIDEIKELTRENARLERMINDYMQTEEILREKGKRYNSLFNDSRDAIFISDSNGKFIDINQSMLEMFGYKRKEILNMYIKSLFIDMEDFLKLKKVLDRKGYVKDYEIMLCNKNGSKIDIILTSSVIYSVNGAITGYQGILRDITKRKKIDSDMQQLINELHSMSFIDDLTGLYNRRGFFSIAEKQTEMAKRLQGNMFIIFIDMDNLKSINDNFGHSRGDQALIEAAMILKKTYREADVIARMGGDEFAIIAMKHGEITDDILLTRLQENIEAYNKETEEGCRLSMSIGIVHFSHQTDCSIDDLLSLADTLMYEDKNRKKIGIQF